MGILPLTARVSKSTSLTAQIYFKTSPKGTRPRWDQGHRGLEHIPCSLPKLFPLDSVRAHMEQLSTRLAAKNIHRKCEFPRESKQQPWQEGVTLD